MRARILMLAAIAGGLLAGCSTVTTMHYDLSPAANGSSTAPGKANSTTPYRLVSVEVPEAIDVSTLIVRQPDNSLMVLSHDKWVGSLGEALRNSVTAGLSAELGLPPMPESMLPAQIPGNVADVAIKVEQFEMQPAKQASLSALWQVNFRNPPRQTITCYSTWNEPVSAGVAALVAAQQRNMQQLAQQLAVTLQTGKPPEASNCRVGKV